MKPGLSLRVSQHLALTPQLQQSIRLLQLSTLELSSEVEQMLDDNPFLEREEDGAPFVLEINTIPGMTPSSLLPKAAAASGWPYEDLCEKIAELSLVTPRK